MEQKAEENRRPVTKRVTTADYLSSYPKSPYSYPANDRQTVSGTSTLKGSWQQPSDK